MSFFVTLKKNDDGVLEVTSVSGGDNVPPQIDVNGHTDDTGQVVDITARVPGLYATSSRR